MNTTDQEDDMIGTQSAFPMKVSTFSDMTKMPAYNIHLVTLYHGNAIDILHYPPGLFDVTVTSPPYNLGKSNMAMGGDRKNGGREERLAGIGYSDDMLEQRYQIWQIAVLNSLLRATKEGGSLFYNHKDRIRQGELISPLQWLTKTGWTLRQIIIWDRGSTHNHSPVYCWPEHEYIFWLTKGKPTLAGKINRSSVWKITPAKPSWHPAPFPPEIPRRCLQMVAHDGMVVLDPFAGSGTTVKVAAGMGYDILGIDSNAEYIARIRADLGMS